MGNETDTRCEQNLNEASGPRKIQKAFHQSLLNMLCGTGPGPLKGQQ